MSWLEDKNQLYGPEIYSAPITDHSERLIGHRDIVGNIRFLSPNHPIGLQGPAVGAGPVFSPCGNIIGRIDPIGRLSPLPTIDLPKPHW